MADLDHIVHLHDMVADLLFADEVLIHYLLAFHSLLTAGLEAENFLEGVLFLPLSLPQPPPLRTALKNNDDQRLKFSAVFARYGARANWKGYSVTTLLLTHLCFEDGSPAADHIWIAETKGTLALGTLQPGQKLTFEARVGAYEKGYKYRGKALTPVKADFKLNRPTKVKKA